MHEEFNNYFSNLDVDFNYTKENFKSVNYTFQNHDVDLKELSSLEQNVKIKFSKIIEDYKKLEYEKLSQRFSDFMFNILVTKNVSFLFDTISIDDLAYKNKFLKSIELYLFNICKEKRFKNDYVCNINTTQATFKINDKNLKPCEIFSANFSYQQVILSIIDKKIVCNGGYNLSRELIFKPLEVYLIDIGINNALFEYSLKETEVENNIKLINYILYSIIMGLFIFFIISGLISIYRGK